MKKSTIIVIVVIVLIAIWGITSYNGMVKMDESVSTAWSNVENQYQRRSDLIPNLVNTVKGYASHEKETFQAVVDARSKATQMQISADDLTPEKMQAYQKAQGEVGSALSRLLAITEAYPDLKANENFKELQAQLEGYRKPDQRRTAKDSMTQHGHITQPSVLSPVTCLLACSDLTNAHILNLRKEPIKHLR